jgi:hypothetical protein
MHSSVDTPTTTPLQRLKRGFSVNTDGGGPSRSRLGSNDSTSHVGEAMSTVYMSKSSDNSWADDIRISFLECMLFIMWDYRKFVKRGWYKSTLPTFDTKGYCKSFQDKLLAADKEIEKEKRDKMLNGLSLEQRGIFLEKEKLEREKAALKNRSPPVMTNFMETASKTQAFITFIEDILTTTDGHTPDSEIALFNSYLDLTQGHRPGKDRAALERLISRRYVIVYML